MAQKVSEVFGAMRKWIIVLLFLLISSIGFAGIEFDNADDNINLGDIDAADTASELTISAWVYHESTVGDDAIYQKISSAITNGILFFRDNFALISGRTDTYNIFIEDSADGDIFRIEGASNASTSQTWTHVATTIIKGNSTGLRLYINGIEDANGPIDLTNLGGFDAGTRPLRIGQGESTTVRTFHGGITEYAVWDKSLTAAEILLLATSKAKRLPLQIQPANLLFYLPMDDVADGVSADAVTLKDLSSAGNDGTGEDGANNTGLTGRAEEVLTYP